MPQRYRNKDCIQPTKAPDDLFCPSCLNLMIDTVQVTFHERVGRLPTDEELLDLLRGVREDIDAMDGP